jgi:hypothetical protein
MILRERNAFCEVDGTRSVPNIGRRMKHRLSIFSFPFSLSLASALSFGCATPVDDAASSDHAELENPGVTELAATSTQCKDGVDNDGDGLVDWQYDVGCYGAADTSEAGLPRAQEAGWTTFNPSSTSRLIYVSSATGVDSNDGRSPARAVKTLARGAALVRDKQNDFLLLERGGKWRDETLGKFKSGESAARPLVIGSYGTSTVRPRIEVDDHFIDHGGDTRSFVALVGLEIVSFPKVPKDPAFDGDTGGGLRYVGNGSNLLVEDCRFLYSEIGLQSYGSGSYSGIELRRNLIERSYNVGTCGQSSSRRPSGIYSHHIKGLLVEENLIDHNGWNPEQAPEACASMYNHNMYLNADDLVVRGNLVLRASSMGLKMRSDSSGEVNRITVEDNLFVDGEIGVGIGGNTDAPYRFTNVTIRNNVFSQIGMSNPTSRDFAWYLQLSDNDNTLVERNLFLNQPWFDNAYGIKVDGGTARKMLIQENTFYGLRGPLLHVVTKSTWTDLTVRKNTFVDPSLSSCLVQHTGAFTAVKYESNSYSGVGTNWFCVDRNRVSLASWITASGETGALKLTPNFVDPNRTLASYAGSRKLTASVDGFVNAAKKQSRLSWRTDLAAAAVNAYIRAGFQPQAK